MSEAPLPALRYWSEGEGWTSFDSATRYEQEQPTMPEPHGPGASVAWVSDLPRDLDGWPYDPNDGELTGVSTVWRRTRCCAAPTSIMDGVLYCKACFHDQPLEADTPPRLDGNWNPGDGPITVRLDS